MTSSDRVSGVGNQRQAVQRAGRELDRERIRRLYIEHWHRVGRIRHPFLDTLSRPTQQPDVYRRKVG